MFQFLMDNGYLTARSYVDKNEFYRDVDAGRITYPVFVKPVKGSISIR
jgi:carbamoyl-phosphate synthase large subunit